MNYTKKKKNTYLSNNFKNKKKIKKPTWIKIKFPVDYKKINFIKEIMFKNKLNSVCQEASCPNLQECFNKGTVTFIILGQICTRKCPFCDIKYGKPNNIDFEEPIRISKTIKEIGLKHVVLTSVTRDDLHDGGAGQFVNCIKIIREENPSVTIEILVPDFRNNLEKSLKIISITPPDIFNHNIESVPRLYGVVRPGGNYEQSLKLLRNFKKNNEKIPTKSGIMLGLGETKKEIFTTMKDLRECGVTMITIGQYLQPSIQHLPVKKYVTLNEFEKIRLKAISFGFVSINCGPFVRSSYHADLKIKDILNENDIL